MIKAVIAYKKAIAKIAYQKAVAAVAFQKAIASIETGLFLLSASFTETLTTVDAFFAGIGKAFSDTISVTEQQDVAFTKSAI